MAKSKEMMRKDLAPTLAEGGDTPSDWEVKDAADTLMRGEEIKKNKKLMPHVHKHINKKIRSLKDLKKLAVEKDMQDTDNDGDVKGDTDKDNM